MLMDLKFAFKCACGWASHPCFLKWIKDKIWHTNLKLTQVSRYVVLSLDTPREDIYYWPTRQDWCVWSEVRTREATPRFIHFLHTISEELINHATNYLNLVRPNGIAMYHVMNLPWRYYPGIGSICWNKLKIFLRNLLCWSSSYV